MTAEERQEEKARLLSVLNNAYRDLFTLNSIGKVRLTAARKTVLKDLDSIMRGRAWFPDKDGHYDPYRSAIEEGFRMCAMDLIKKIESTPNESLKGKDRTVKVRKK